MLSPCHRLCCIVIAASSSPVPAVCYIKEGVKPTKPDQKKRFPTTTATTTTTTTTTTATATTTTTAVTTTITTITMTTRARKRQQDDHRSLALRSDHRPFMKCYCRFGCLLVVCWLFVGCLLVVCWLVVGLFQRQQQHLARCLLGTKE